MCNISPFDVYAGFTPSIYATLVHMVKDYKSTRTPLGAHISRSIEL